MNKDIIIKNSEGEVYDIPPEGSLGLLALGYVGIMAWREKKKALQYQVDQVEKDSSLS
jgi:hypothetical protein